MKNRLKIISYYLLEFILAILIFMLTIILVMKFTILKKEYLIKKLDSNNYYDSLYLDIMEETKNYLTPSGFNDDILDNVYDKSIIKKEIINLINNFYNNKSLNINTNLVRDNLNNNIKEYLLKNNLEVRDQDSLNMFTDEVVKIYSSRIKILNNLDTYQIYFNKLNNYINNIIVILIVIIIIISLIIKFIIKKYIFIIPIISSMIIILLFTNYIFSRVDINNIIIWNNYVSLIIRNILFDMKNYLNKIAIILIIFELFKLIVLSFKKS